MRRPIKGIFIGIFLVATAFSNTANAALPENSIYVEGLGAGILYSLNYERVFAEDFGARLGFGGLSLSGTDSDGTTANVFLGLFPISFNYLGLRSRSDNHILDLGLGGTIVVLSGTIDTFGLGFSGTTAMAHATVGYRYQHRFFQFRIGVNPLYLPGEGGGFTALPYISFGGGF